MYCESSHSASAKTPTSVNVKLQYGRAELWRRHNSSSWSIETKMCVLIVGSDLYTAVKPNNTPSIDYLGFTNLFLVPRHTLREHPLLLHAERSVNNPFNCLVPEDRK